MSNVQFQDEYQTTRSMKQKGIEGLVISLGLAKDRKSAQVVLLVILIVAVVVAVAAPMILGNGKQAQVSEQEMNSAFSR